jgi:hypothetical protein
MPTEQTLGKKKHPHDRPDSPITQARNATDAGFYLEAISIWETLISQDLEQYLNTLQGSNVRYSGLGKLLNKLEETLYGLKRSEPENALYELLDPLHDWYGTYHNTLHSLASFNDPKQEKWNESYSYLKKLAKDGKKLFKHIHKLTQSIRLGH